jgi:hypothetical protein
MNNFLRTIIAGYGAKKLGGGCFGTILVFIIIYYALGTCNSHPVQTSPQHHSSIQKLPAPLPGRKPGIFGVKSLYGDVLT